MKNSNVHAAIFGGLISIIGLITGIFFWQWSLGNSYYLLPIYGAFSGFLTALLIWRITVKRITIIRGVVSGIGASVFSFWLVNYLVIIHANVSFHVFHRQTWASLGQPPIDLIQGIFGAVVLGLAGLFLFGWISVLAAGLIGGIVAWYFKNH